MENIFKKDVTSYIFDPIKYCLRSKMTYTNEKKTVN